MSYIYRVLPMPLLPSLVTIILNLAFTEPFIPPFLMPIYAFI